MVGGPRAAAGDAGTETDDTQVGGGLHACAGAVAGVGTSGWDGEAGAETGGRSVRDQAELEYLG